MTPVDSTLVCPRPRAAGRPIQMSFNFEYATGRSSEPQSAPRVACLSDAAGEFFGGSLNPLARVASLRAAVLAATWLLVGAKKSAARHAEAVRTGAGCSVVIAIPLSDSDIGER